jgi:hypothetical protein
MADFDEVSERYHRALEGFILGDAEPVRSLWSRRDDVTLANPLGPPVRGWDAVREVMDRAASQLRDGEAFSIEPRRMRRRSWRTSSISSDPGSRWVAPMKWSRPPSARRPSSDARMTDGGSSIAMPIRSRARGRLSR